MKNWRVYGIVLFMLSACATYYQKQYDFMSAIYNEQYHIAEKILTQKKVPKRDKLLYFLNKGSLYWMMNEGSKSNYYFQQADYYVEDYKKNYAAISASYLTNPSIIPYGGETFEQLLIHYYTVLNFIQMGDKEKALVEAKRMLIKQQKIIDYNKSDNKYNDDAFVHTLLGIVYEINSDYNNAFIAYRNAYKIYVNEYKPFFNLNCPEQLKYDLIRTAYTSGLYEEQREYEKLFNIKHIPDKDSTVSFFFFWNNGLGPVKYEESINFYVLPASGNDYVLVNDKYSLRIPYHTNNDDESSALRELKIVRIAFPQYKSRKPLYRQARVYVSDSVNFPLYRCQPVDEIAYRALQDRFLKEIATAIVRMTAKRIAQNLAARKNEGAGLALEIINAATEKADTRNWQLLPHDIMYTRVCISSSLDTVSLQLRKQDGGIHVVPIKIDKSKKGKFIQHYQSPQFTAYTVN